jgi:hypothetical protein
MLFVTFEHGEIENLNRIRIADSLPDVAFTMGRQLWERELE